jgi:hypothetical protein
MDNTVMEVVDLPGQSAIGRDLILPQSLAGPPGINARRFKRQMGVRKSTTTTAHGEPARTDKAQLWGLLHAHHYRA